MKITAKNDRLAYHTSSTEFSQLLIDVITTPASLDNALIGKLDSQWSSSQAPLLAPNFADNTLPAGRPQGIAGPLAASRLMRLAIPDLRCEIEQMIVAGDRVVTHLRFRGHFTGRFGQIQGQSQTINFIATDIYRVRRWMHR
ncbi:MAG TPA: ester cyclase [Candidatus Sulfotelmatobacter sp.]